MKLKNLQFALLVALITILSGAGIATAINVSVPVAPSSGYGLISTTTGAWIYTTLTPFTVGAITATSTKIKSTFSYASTTALSSPTLCISNDCRTSWPSSSGSGNVSTSTSETSGYVPYWTSTASTPATLGSDSGFQFNATNDRLTVPYASTTALSATTLCLTTCITSFSSGTVTSITAGLGLDGGTITTSGTLSLKSYIATSTADTANQVLFFTSTGSTPATFGGHTGLTYSSTASLLTATYASTTAMSVSGSLAVPTQASTTKTIAVSDTQFKFVAGNGLTNILTGTSSPAVNLASTSLDAFGKKFNSATSTFLLKNDPEPFTLIGFYCVASSTGTALVHFADDAGNSTETSTCTSGSFTRTVSNNTWTAFEGFNIVASSTKGQVSRITVTAVVNKTSD